MRRIEGPLLSPLTQSDNTRPPGAIGVGLSLDPEGRLKGGGGLISERILEIPLKINDIEKVNTLQFDKRNPFKTEQTKKIKN